MQWRGAVTNQLSDVIQTIQLVRRSGSLKVEKNENGTTLAEGTITFVSGQITNAQLGPLRGTVAYGTIMSWKSCRFTFLPADPSQSLSGPLPPLPARGSNTSPHDTGSGSYSFERRESRPGSFPDTGTRTPLARDTPPANLQRDTGASGRLPNAASVPSRIRDVNEALPAFASMGFSRLHRHLFLLIDGRRNLAELVHILGRQSGEVYMLLADLERAGFIQQS